MPICSKAVQLYQVVHGGDREPSTDSVFHLLLSSPFSPLCNSLSSVSFADQSICQGAYCPMLGAVSLAARVNADGTSVIT